MAGARPRTPANACPQHCPRPQTDLPKSSTLMTGLLCLAIAFSPSPYLIAHQGCFIPALLLDSQSTLTLHADRQQELNNIYNLQGHVRMTHREMRMSADSPTYDEGTFHPWIQS